MAARSPLRFLAPVAIAVVLVASIIVVATTDGGSTSDKAKSTSSTAPTRTVPRRRTYRVKEGDTLTAISEKTGVPTGTLLALNPGLDPQTLQPGDRLKLRP